MSEEIDDTKDDIWLEPTTNPLVKYDALTEEYIVTLDDKTVAAIYGGHRNSWAFAIAEWVALKKDIDT